ncbi:MAG: DUF2723 domain-containing protein [Kofleriaceae bacterium]
MLAAVAYLWLAPAHIVDGDNAELSTLGGIGGVPHPTGYPLLMIYLRLMQWLPGSTPAHTAALATALVGAASIIVLHAACRAWGAKPLAATIACAIFAAAPVVVEMNTECEVFALNDLVVGTILLLAATNGPVKGLWRALLLGLVAGLGLSDHVTCALTFPIGILGIVRTVRESSWRAIAVATGGIVIGLLPYAYLLITAENARSWGRHIDSFGALLFHFLRKDYGGPGAFAPNRPDVPMLDNLWEYVKTIGRWWLYVPAIGGAIAIGRRIVRKDIGAAVLFVTWLISGPLLVLRFNVELEGVGLFVVHRFHLMSALIWAVPVAWALSDVIPDRLAERTLLNVAALIAFVGILVTSLPFVQAVHSPAVERNVRNMLASLPQDSVVIVAEDDLDFGSSYVQLMLHERPDVHVIMWYAISRPATRERVEAELGFPIPKVGNDIFVAHFAQKVLDSKRPLFVDTFQKHVLEAYPSYPYGILFRVLPQGTARPSIREVFAINKELFGKFVIDYPKPSWSAPWPAHVHERMTRTWTIIHDALVADHDDEDAAFALELAKALVPDP